MKNNDNNNNNTTNTSNNNADKRMKRSSVKNPDKFNSQIDDMNPSSDLDNIEESSSNRQVNRNRRTTNSTINANGSFSNSINEKLNNLRKNNKKKKDESQSDKNAKTSKDSRAKASKNKLAQAAAAVGKARNAAQTMKDVSENGASAVKSIVEEKTKGVIKKKIRVFLLTKVLIPILPFLLIAIGVIALLIILVAIFVDLSREEVLVNTMRLNYCNNVHVTWKELDEHFVEVEKEATMSKDDYIVYQMSLTDFDIIDNKEVLRALSVIYRTNLYALSNNMESDTCEFEIDQPYYDPKEDEKNAPYYEALNFTDNKIFAVDENNVIVLEIDNDFTYRNKDEIFVGPVYYLSQDYKYYVQSWIDEHVPSSHIVQGTAVENSFSPWAAWYIADKDKRNYHELLYHFYDRLAGKGDIYNVIKYGSGSDIYDSYCSDISLTETTLTREEFIASVMSNVNEGAFKSNAGKIYDISIANNFNPEMVVIRARAEGFSPGGSTYNFWGLACYNGTKAENCKSYPSFDAGVLAFIDNIKSHNYGTAYQMMMKYSYIGKFWFNTSDDNRENTGNGGCYYFPHIREFMSATRAEEVAQACVSGKWCKVDGSGDCLPTTDEDQSAYAKWQVSKMSQLRSQIFGLSPEVCNEEGNPVETGDLSTLGERVAQYAVATYDTWSYDQNLRHRDGYVDCSSMVSRAYAHFSFKIYDTSDTAGEIERWCEKNNKLISESELQPGDLIFFTSSSSKHKNKYHHIYHVSMSIGPGKQFAAHGKWKDEKKGIELEQYKQVSVTDYNGGGSYFCRPSK